MKVICEQADLSRYLQIITRAISTKSTLPILTGILVETKDNYLHCVATDLEISIEINVPNVEIIEKGAIVLPGKTFVDIIRHLPSGKVEFGTDKNSNMVLISGSHSSFQLPLLPTEEFPLLPEVKDNSNFKVNGLLLKEAIKQTVYATLAEDPRPFLSSILWEINHDRLRLVATDINRLAIRDIPINCQLQTTALIPVRSFKEIANIFGNSADEDLEVSISDRVLFVKGLGINFSSRLVDAQFPRYEQVIPKEFKGTLKVKRDQFISALERSALVSNSVKIKIGNQQMILTAKEPDKGNAFEEIEVDVSGSDLEIGFNVRFLLDFLKSVDTEKVIFNYIQEQKSVLLQGEARDDYFYVVMPLKLVN
ncbi:MAG TPA: DNA polymerase III subunit beta [Bacillota bacterium]|jgi:DNA polymerase-3 subunit beta|nr:DNA polymerase III subunit beta [Bacillota bacterium]HOL10270.1 DNA polymerase III subunit beta [Bacillota bacterium]